MIHENDVQRLQQFGQVIKETFRDNLAAHATARSAETLDERHDAHHLFDGNRDTYRCTREGVEQAAIEIDLQEEQTFDRIVLMEHLSSGQRIEQFKLDYKEGADWKELYDGTIVGYKRICRFESVKARYVKLTITESRWYPTLSCFGVY